MRREPSLNEPGTPLVSVCVFNYNYGRYLRECLESVVSQRYDNIEICFSDNASTDDSWDIALDYARRYPGIMTITRNRRNFGSDANFANCFLNVRGKYYVELCSDDALLPDYVGKCVSAMESWPNAGYTMVHRAIIDENGRKTDEAPFYTRSCLIPGPEQAAVYMMAAVNPSISQVMYRKAFSAGKSVPGGIATQWYGTRLKDFHMCCEFPMIYLSEPLLLHRVHSGSDSSRAAETMLEIVGPYVLQHQFAEIAMRYGLTRVAERLPQSIEKLGHLCLRYCARAICAGHEAIGRKYLHMAMAIAPGIVAAPTYRLVERYWDGDEAARARTVAALHAEADLIGRCISYEPPSGSTPLS